MGVRGRTMKYFWVYLLLFFTVAFVLIYVTSTSQMNAKQKTDELAQRQAQGVETRMVDLTKANEDLRGENQKLTDILALKEKDLTVFKETNDILLLVDRHLKNDQKEEARTLLNTITSVEGMTQSQIELYNELKEKVK